MMKRSTFIVMCMALLAMVSQGCKDGGNRVSMPSPVGYDEITMNGDLKFRLQQNLDLLNAMDSVQYPETEILSLVSAASASRKPSIRLNDMITALPSHLNSLGYIGPDDAAPDENLLAANGLILKGLCAYYNMSSDRKSLEWISSIALNLFVKNKELCTACPLAPGLEGLAEAYRLVGTPEMKEVIDGMIARFLETDLAAAKASTSALLSACRGLVSYSEITGESRWVDEARSRWNTYKENGMTENFESYRQLGVYGAGSDPSAAAASFILANKFWQHTADNDYLKVAHLIYFNALCHMQRSDGSFGSDTCPGEASGPDLSVVSDDVCPLGSMAGAEALATAAAFTFMKDGSTIYVLTPRSSSYSFGGLELDVETDYPNEGLVIINVLANLTGKDAALKLFIPSWMNLGIIDRGGKRGQATVGKDGFITLDKLKTGDKILLEYTYSPKQEPVINAKNTKPGQARYFNGPYILSEEGEPITHLMDPKVSKAAGYHHQILFNGF